MKSRTLLTMLILTICICIAHAVEGVRDIKLSLNRHNFEMGDSLHVSAQFIGFETDSIIGDVYVDIVNDNDDVIASYRMESDGNSHYSLSDTIPQGWYNEPEDLLKLCQYLSMTKDNICAAGFPVVLIVDKEVVNPISYPAGPKSNYLYLDSSANSLTEFRKIPKEKLLYISAMPIGQLGRTFHYLRKYIPAHPNHYILRVNTSDYYTPRNIHKLQVSAMTSSGEIVAAIEPINLHVIIAGYYRPKQKEKKVLPDSNKRYMEDHGWDHIYE